MAGVRRVSIGWWTSAPWWSTLTSRPLPGEVAAQVQSELERASADGWELQLIQPIIYNSSTTGYLLLIFSRDRPETA